LSDDGTITFANKAQGLDKVQVEKLFDRFYTVEAARNSSGLGLSIAKTMVEQMNGEITAEFESGRLFIYVRFTHL
jgi:signal transduction histidine kinase